MQDWDLSRFEANPVVLWNHGMSGGLFGGGSDDSTLPIGYASNVRVEDGSLKATLHFVDATANPIAEKVFQGYLQGSLRAVSVGWEAGEATYDESSDTLVLSQNKLIEISAVAIPANAEAVRESAAMFAALRVGSTSGDKTMKVSATALLAALGLSSDSTEAEATEAVRALVASKGQLGTIIAALNADSFADAVGLAAGLKAKAEAFDAKELELASIREERAREAFMSAFADAEREGKIVPANRANCLSICGAGEDGAGGNMGTLKALVATLPVVANRAAAVTPRMPSSSEKLSAAEEAKCKANGWDVAKYLETKRKISGASAQEGIEE